VRINRADVNNFSKIRFIQYSTNSNSYQKPSAKRTFINELPDGAEIVKNKRQNPRTKLNDEEISQAIVDYTENGLGVCEIARKNGCHHSTVSKILKTRLRDE